MEPGTSTANSNHDIDHTSSSDRDTTIPIIDFRPFLDNTANKQSIANAIIDSFKRIGFVYLINHGVDNEKIGGMFEWSKKFFNLPMEIKQLAPHPSNGAHHRGYSSPGLEKVSQSKYDSTNPESDLTILRKSNLDLDSDSSPDVKESFEVGREDDPLMPNIWFPNRASEVFPGFKEACLDFYWTCDEFKYNILRALSLGLGLEENFLDDYHRKADNQLRLLHYPSVPTALLKNSSITRIGAHSDFGSITILFQDDVGGLEVEDPNMPNVFRPVPVVEGGIIVNAGDFLMRWSNDIIRSTVHRVRAPPNANYQMKIFAENEAMTPERYSIPYFCSTDFSKTVECLPGTWSDTNPKRYGPISAQEYIMKRLAASYST